MSASRWTEANRNNWDDRARAHVADPGQFYDFNALRAGASSLLPLERELAGEVRGKRLLHLQCHLGTDSISWARAGATVTAVDFSPAAIALARELTTECGVPIDFHVGDVYDLPAACDGPFDIIMMTYGTIPWLRDLGSLMRVIAARLAPGGRYVLVDGHPLSDMVPDDPMREGWHLRTAGYFHVATPLRLDEPFTYTGSSTIAHSENYQWSHDIGEIIQSMLDAGLILRTFREEPYGFFRRFPGMTKRADGYWQAPPGAPSIPLLFALAAERGA
jgi:SAM-dependent methyltransferase